ncbi:unnamed protein product [Paramecium primaurelia]|uniref:Uncharacterized protein n=1 Tax=Paramecium primaurelia TaxID=5886 RepID=A0A8S1P6R2_PARPR|nr:unnamed protein product [Paramecium primaurelia]
MNQVLILQIIEVLEQCHKDKSIKTRECCIEIIKELLHKITSELNHDNLIALEKHFNLVTTLNELDYINDEDIFLKSIARVRSCL